MPQFLFHTQSTQPLMQQWSGSSGLGGTRTPATILPFSRIFLRRSRRAAGPARGEPNTMRAFSAASAGGGVGVGDVKEGGFSSEFAGARLSAGSLGSWAADDGGLKGLRCLYGGGSVRRMS
ncbi:uncharacterized protein PpBr36_10277 [Pyricularia pennisetigena]|uniref:uncharacterized protein n=1 Tax=Pyricularia pennisetigena TaxID=1578925 RepID=UPI00114E1E5E|nr:uncharacterized protein PpBr36_10277 [Pyricularia pennisetigena]TLS21534.1 hypothetical protein PpBr36_10277 [Pyricularia pennisetigena]